MRTKITVIFTLFLFAMMVGCSDDSVTNNPSSSDLEGTWDMTQYVYTSNANSSLTEDILQTQQLSLTMTITSNGSFTLTTTVMGQSFTSSGQFNTNGNDISSSDPNTSVELSGNTLTITTNNTTWNFGNGDEPATVRQVYQRR